MIAKKRRDVQKFVMTSKYLLMSNHDIKKSVMTSKNPSWRQNTSWRQKVCHWCKAVHYDIKMTSKKFVVVSWRQKYVVTKQKFVMTSKHIMMSKICCDVKKFVKDTSWRQKHRHSIVIDMLWRQKFHYDVINLSEMSNAFLVRLCFKNILRPSEIWVRMLEPV